MSDSSEFDGYVIEPINPLWKLHPYLPLADAAALLAGYDPSQVGRCQNDTYFREWFPDYWPAVYAMTGAVLAGELDADRDKIAEFQSKNHNEKKIDVDPRLVRLKVIVIREWLASKGHRAGFFFPDAKPSSSEYLDPLHPRYAPKLAAAVRAWEAVKEPVGKSPKQALIKWLRENGAAFGLTDEDGKPNETGIEECAKVANWVPSGGVAKTPDREA